MGLTWFTRSDPRRDDKSRPDPAQRQLPSVAGNLRLDAQINYDLKQSKLQNERYHHRPTTRSAGACIVEYRDFQATGFQTATTSASRCRLKNVGTFLDLPDEAPTAEP